MMYKLIIGALVVYGIIGCSDNNLLIKGKNMKTKKDIVVELLNAIETDASASVAYISQNRYIQHNLAVKDGLEGFDELLQLVPKDSVKVDVIRVFEDGDYVFTHTKYNFFGKKVGFDIFRFENGKIVEHWDNMQDIAEHTKSGRTQLDGTTNITDIEKTESNKERIKNFIDDVLLGTDPQKITQYISTTSYLQHNPYVNDGLDGLGEALEELAKADMPMVYKKNHMILGEGNFVLAVSEGIFMKNHVAFYDLFRLENDKIVEHWDTIEKIPPKAKWQNSNGKF